MGGDIKYCLYCRYRISPLPLYSHCVYIKYLIILLSSPLTGLFFRTLTFLEYDIKPVFVFDGRPPGEKRAVVSKD